MTIYVKDPKVVSAYIVDLNDEKYTQELLLWGGEEIEMTDEGHLFITNYHINKLYQSVSEISDAVKDIAYHGDYVVRMPDSFVFAASPEWFESRYVDASLLHQSVVDDRLLTRINEQMMQD